MAEEKITPKRLYPLDKTKILEIDEEQYVEEEQADSLFNRSSSIGVLYFNLTEEYEIFADDPVCGADRSAFRKSSIQGPFNSEPEQQKREYAGGIETWHSVIPLIVSLDQQLDVKRYYAHSCLVCTSDTLGFYIKDTGRIERLKTSLYQELSAKADYSYKSEGKLEGKIGESFFSYCFSPGKSVNHYVSLKEFSKNPSSSNLFGYFADFENNFNLDKFFAHEEFTSLSEIDLSKSYSSLEGLMSSNPLIPNSLHRLGKY